MKELNKNLENIFDNLALKNFYDNNQKLINLCKPMLNYKLGISSELLEIGKIFDNSTFKVLQENQQRLHDLYKPILSNDLKITSKLLEIAKLFDNSVFKVLQENQQIFKNFISLNNFTMPTFETDKYFDYIDKIDKIDKIDISEIIVEDFTKEEKEELDNLIDLFSKTFTENEFFKKLSNMGYKNKIIYFIFFILIPNIHFYYNLIQNKSTYVVNRDNVRIRETPTTETNKNIIKKLTRNEYVIKIDNKDGWVKVKYNLEDGKEIEGWIYKTMLSKID